ncbi:indole-3-glycerol phosphate synthase TrpC [Oligoflexus tunisiensis]|uniref:indole-3-glycerol phosphate synthase TrpC n=1 Tax=Oligoflexus tunisiensis TaxID=708132 RepID=UPI000B166DD9|nr:indole-3-glycerol phosphate synthase TrpC [Oligoflexus tunisiensis]
MSEQDKTASSVLHKIGRTVAERVKRDRAQESEQDLLARIAASGWKPKDFRALFDRRGFNVIAEIKLASPSRGDIAPGLQPLDVARAYLENGAAALSILTEPLFFKGDIKYLKAIRAAYPEAYLLQKDFIIDPYQLYQAKAAGADAILIIVALLGEQGSAEILRTARQLGLTALVEVHNAEEMAIATRIGADLVGINNRNLKDLSISLDVSLQLRPMAPAGARLICESGIETHEDMHRLHAEGFHGFLVGTSLMRTGRPGDALARLIRHAH